LPRRFDVIYHWRRRSCPICNKLVVLALGVSGALSYFAPIQPVLGLASVALLIYALLLRFRALNGSCSVSPRQQMSS
jgi:hypothetical protein